MLMTALIPLLLKFRAICHPFFKAICHRPPMTCAFMCRRIRPPSRPGSWSVRAHDAVVDKRPLGGRAGAGPRTLSDLAPFLWKKGFPWLGWLATRASSCAPPNAGSTGTGARGWPGWLARGRSDKDTPHFSATLRQAIEGLALQRPHRFAAAIHRQAVTIAERLGESPPSYGFVYALIRRLDPALMTLAHEGSKVYADTFDLVHRYESAGPNRVGCHGFVRSGGRGVNGNPTTRMS